MGDVYTHLAKIYGFKCYYNINTGDLIGTNWFNDYMISIFIWLDVDILQINDCFKIEILEEL